MSELLAAASKRFLQTSKNRSDIIVLNDTSKRTKGKESDTDSFTLEPQ
jgi:hypothetical protein